jgi:hypothetical protein
MKFKRTLITAAMATMMTAGGLTFTETVMAGKGDNNKGADYTVNDDLSRRPAGSESGSGDTVEANCGGPDYQGATGQLTIQQSGGKSEVTVEVEDAVPNTHFTVWMRIKGGSGFNNDGSDGVSDGSPWTGGGATPLCSGTEFDSLNDNSPWNNAAGSQAGLCNSFFTGDNGDGKLKTTVNFPIVGGAYPFQQSGGTPSRPGHDGHADVPTAIVDPRTGNGGPFMIRVVSHCLDNANHGLSPSNREAWFQYP